MTQWFFLSLVGGALLALGYFAYCIAFSSLRPLRILGAGWNVALNSPRKNPKIFGSFVLLVSFGVALQLYFTYVPGFRQITLFLTSISWQAISATLTALLAVPIQLFVIDGLLARPLYWGGPVEKRSVSRKRLWPLLWRAAAFGFVIWLLSTVLRFGGNALLITLPGQAKSISSYALPVITFLITTAFSLVRPAVALELARPFRTGIKVALKHALPLYLMTALFLGISFSASSLVRYISPYFLTGQDANMVSMIILLIYNAFQLLAVEASTVIFMKKAVLQPAERINLVRPGLAAISVLSPKSWLLG